MKYVDIQKIGMAMNSTNMVYRKALGVSGLVRCSILIFSLIFFSACQRDADQFSHIRLQLSQNSPHKAVANKAGLVTSQSVPIGFVPAHIVVNLHFDGQLASFDWDCPFLHGNNSDPSLCQFPPIIDFGGQIFPYGQQRTIQVLLVYGNEDGALLFAYADKAGQSFSSPFVEVSIGSAGWNFQGGGKQGDVSGHHASSLTGDVIGTFTPPIADRPKMILFDEAIFSGWFEFMFFEGVQISYHHQALDGSQVPLFSNVDLIALKSQIGSSSAAAVIEAPSFYSTYPDFGGGAESRFSEAASYIFGYFSASGAPMANGAASSMTLPTVSMALYGSGSESAYRSLDPNGTLIDPIDSVNSGWRNPTNGNFDNSISDTEWATSSYGVDWITGISAAGTNTDDIIQVSGMTTPNPTACGGVADSNLVEGQCFKVSPELIFQGRLLPFEGPFETIYNSTDSRYYSLETTESAGVHQIKWRFLPNVDTVAVNGVSVFLVDKSYENSLHEDVPCGDWGFSHGLTYLPPPPFFGAEFPPPADFAVDVPAVGLGEYSVDMGPYNTTNQMAVACPWQAVGGTKKYSSVAVMNHGFESGNNNCCNSNQPATQLAVEVLGNLNTINRDACVPLVISAKDSNGSESNPSVDTIVNLTSPSLVGNFYPPGNSLCDQGPIGVVVLKQFESRTNIFFKATSSGGAGTFEVVDGNGIPTLSSGSFAINSISLNMASLGVGAGLKIYTQNIHTIHGCEPVSFMSVDNAGFPAPYTTTKNIYVDDSASGGYYYYSEMECMEGVSPVSVFAITPPEIFKNLYYRNTTAAVNTVINLRGNDGGVSVIYDNTNITMEDPLAPSSSYSFVSHVSGTPPMEPFRTGFCYPLNIYLMDENKNLSPSLTLISNISVDVDGGASLSLNADCSTPVSSIGTISISATYISNSGSAVYIMPLMSNYTVTVSVPTFNAESFAGPMADLTKLQVTSTMSLNPSMCNSITTELQDSVGAPLSGISYKSYSTDINYMWDNSMASGSYLSSDFSGCSPNNGLSFQPVGAFNALGTFDIGLSVMTVGSGPLTITAPGMTFVGTANFTW